MSTTEGGDETSPKKSCYICGGTTLVKRTELCFECTMRINIDLPSAQNIDYNLDNNMEGMKHFLKENPFILNVCLSRVIGRLLILDPSNRYRGHPIYEESTYRQFIEWCLENGANPSVVDESDQTVLHHVASYGLLEVGQGIMDAMHNFTNGDQSSIYEWVNHRDDKGMTAADIVANHHSGLLGGGYVKVNWDTSISILRFLTENGAILDVDQHVKRMTRYENTFPLMVRSNSGTRTRWEDVHELENWLRNEFVQNIPSLKCLCMEYIRKTFLEKNEDEDDLMLKNEEDDNVQVWINDDNPTHDFVPDNYFENRLIGEPIWKYNIHWSNDPVFGWIMNMSHQCYGDQYFGSVVSEAIFHDLTRWVRIGKTKYSHDMELKTGDTTNRLMVCELEDLPEEVRNLIVDYS